MGERDEQSDHRWFLGQGNFIWYYNGGYVISHLSKVMECTIKGKLWYKVWTLGDDDL